MHVYLTIIRCEQTRARSFRSKLYAKRRCASSADGVGEGFCVGHVVARTNATIAAKNHSNKQRYGGMLFTMLGRRPQKRRITCNFFDSSVSRNAASAQTQEPLTKQRELSLPTHRFCERATSIHRYAGHTHKMHAHQCYRQNDRHGETCLPTAR